MGDVATHAGLESLVIDIFREHVPEEDVQFVELGNWLTDFSQFRDPTAFLSAKVVVWNQSGTGVAAMPFARDVLANLDAYLDDLMGKPGQDGYLARYAKEIARTVTLHHFVDKRGLDADEIDSLFEKYFTQYYPHEHLDFPPWPWGNIIGDRTPTDAPQHLCDETETAGKRLVFQYTDEQLVYVSDRLTHVQEKWKKWALNESDGSSRRPLHEILCEYGHASHAIEDFFFHSNFIEMAWQRLRGELPENNRDPGNQRRYFRRLRAPLGTGGGADLDTAQSLAADIVYTGYFGSKDMFHSLMDSVKGIGEKLGATPALQKIIGPMLYVPDPDGDDQEQANGLQKKEDRERYLKKYREEYRSGAITAGIDLGVANGEIGPKTAESAKKAMALDEELALKRRGIGVADMGIVGLVLELAGIAETEYANSATTTKKYNEQPLINDLRTNNGASGENIGSHSLMAKDSTRKEPLRAQAVNAASVAAQYVARTMIDVVYPSLALAGARFHRETSDDDRNTVDDPGGLDWLHLVRHFVCHPSECEETWCDRAMDDPGAPTYHVPKFLDQAEIDRRCEEKKKDALEKLYKNGEDYYEDQWKKIMLKDTMVEGAILGAAAGAIIGGIIGGPVGALVGAVVGAVAGGIIGAVVGAIGSLL
jgi:hypothetical protein